MHIYDKLERMCALKGVTVTDAYKAMKINKGTISLWKTARDDEDAITPSAKNAIKMAEYFDCPTDFFLSDNGLVPEQKEKSPTPNGVELDAETVELNNIWNTASEEERAALLEMARFLKSRRQ